MTPARHRFSLEYRDRALEAEYQLATALRARSLYRSVMIAVAVLWIAGVGIDLGTSPANAHVMMLIRFAVVLPILLGVAGFVALASPSAYERHWRWVAPLGFASYLFGLVAFVVFLPEPTRMNPVHGLAAVWLTVVAGFALVATRYVVAFAITVTGSVAFATTICLRWHGDDLPEIAVFWGTIALFTGCVIASYLEAARRDAFWAERELGAERERSERLLRNVMPAAIAERLKDEPRIAEHHEAATVLFADLVGFTPMSQRLSPSALVDILDEIFSAFDDLADRFGLEKIKTIGDAYMAVGGVPIARADHAVAVADLALEMLAVVAARRFGGERVELRIGIHTGPVVAGVIGKRRFAYDLWGDTVNTASRLESHGQPGAIHVSDATRLALGDRFLLEPRGRITIKGKGEMATWFLRSKACATTS